MLARSLRFVAARLLRNLLTTPIVYKSSKTSQFTDIIDPHLFTSAADATLPRRPLPHLQLPHLQLRHPPSRRPMPFSILLPRRLALQLSTRFKARLLRCSNAQPLSRLLQLLLQQVRSKLAQSPHSTSPHQSSPQGARRLPCSPRNTPKSRQSRTLTSPACSLALLRRGCLTRFYRMH